MPVIACTMPPICSLLAASAVIDPAIAAELSRTSAMATPADCSTARCASLSLCTCSSAPAATWTIALDTSLTARPASCELAAICCDAPATTAAESRTPYTIPRGLAIIRAKASPVASRSDTGVTISVRSPSATRSAARTTPCWAAIVRRKASAVRPSSSVPTMSTCWSTSPSASPFAASSSSRALRTI